MAKLGNSEFPEVGLSESVELARRIHDELGGEVRRDGLAIVLGMSPNGGAYGARIGALRMWGLAAGRSILRLTANGVRAASSSTSPESSDVIRMLAASIPLFNELHQRIGNADVDQSVLTALLREITGAETEEVRRRVTLIERIYSGIQPLLETMDSNADDTQRHAALDASTGAVAGHSDHANEHLTDLPEDWIEFRYPDGALRMRETAENLDVLISIAEARRRRLLQEESRRIGYEDRFSR